MSFSNILTGDLTVQVPASYLNLIDIKNHLTNDELLLTRKILLATLGCHLQENVGCGIRLAGEAYGEIKRILG